MIRAGVWPLSCSQKDSGGRLTSWICALVMILLLANSVDVIKGPNSVSPGLLSFLLWVMTPAFLPHRVVRTM